MKTLLIRLGAFFWIFAGTMLYDADHRMTASIIHVVAAIVFEHYFRKAESKEQKQ